MNYKQAISYLNSLNVMGGKLGLAREGKLLAKLGNPHKKPRCILVGGTSGKGSTSAMLASILEQAGFKVGRFTKPHLSRFTERISINGREISESEMARIASQVRAASASIKGEKPTFFEVVVAIALAYFAEKQADFAVLEVGLGGRLDATNCCDALVSVITNVSLEHTDILGSTVRKIAREKAGIIKRNGILVTSAQGQALSVFRNTCRKKKSRLFLVGHGLHVKPLTSDLRGQRFGFSGLKGNYGKLSIPLLGAHQLSNAACAIGAAEALGFYGIEISKGAISRGLKKTTWPGRFEIMQENPLVVIDCAKDASAARVLTREIAFNFRRKYRPLVLVVSISSDKNFREMLAELAKVSDYAIACAHKVMGRAIKPKMLARELEKRNVRTLEVQDVKGAVRKAILLAGKKGMVLAAGSVFAAGEARELWFPARRHERRLNEVPVR